MGKYSDAAKKAEQMHDDEIAGKIMEKRCGKGALVALAKNKPDKKLLEKLSAGIDAAASAQEAKKAWLAFAGKAGDKLIKVARKALIGANA